MVVVTAVVVAELSILPIADAAVVVRKEVEEPAEEEVTDEEIEGVPESNRVSRKVESRKCASIRAAKEEILEDPLLGPPPPAPPSDEVDVFLFWRGNGPWPRAVRSPPG